MMEAVSEHPPLDGPLEAHGAHPGEANTEGKGGRECAMGVEAVVACALSKARDLRHQAHR